MIVLRVRQEVETLIESSPKLVGDLKVEAISERTFRSQNFYVHDFPTDELAVDGVLDNDVTRCCFTTHAVLVFIVAQALWQSSGGFSSSSLP